MIKLTNLEGVPFWVRAAEIKLIRTDWEHNFPADAKAVIKFGDRYMAVQETVEEVLNLLSIKA